MYPPVLPMMLKIFSPVLLISSATADVSRLQLVKKGYSSHFTDKKPGAKETVQKKVSWQSRALKRSLSSH